MIQSNEKRSSYCIPYFEFKMPVKIPSWGEFLHKKSSFYGGQEAFLLRDDGAIAISDISANIIYITARLLEGPL